MTISVKPGLPLAVESLGSGFPILCLHGHPGSADCLRVFTQFLAQRYRTITPDLRGYGRSPARADFTMSDHLLDLEALWDRYQLDQCMILGWSLGGILALEMALRHPQRVRGLILVATAAGPRSSHPPISGPDYLYTAIAALLNGLVPGWTWNIKTFGQRSLFRYLIRQHTPQTYRYLATAALPAYLKTSGRATRALNQALQTRYNRVQDLRHITCPCLVLAGACDRHITPESSRETAANLPTSRWICYPDTAHLFPWEVPQQVQQDIDQWLRDYPSMIHSGAIDSGFRTL